MGGTIWLWEAIYICILAVYLTNIVSLTLKISTDSAIGAPGHGKYVVDNIHERDTDIL